MSSLSSELESLNPESAERHCTNFRGLFGCMQDLNSQVAALERQSTSHGEN